MPAPIVPIKIHFTELADAMRQISEQKVTEKDGKSIYQDDEKVYVKLGDNEKYIIEIGIKAKKSKGIKADQLVETVNLVIQSAATSGVFKDCADESEERLGDMIKGLETLRNRIKARQKSISFIKKLIYKLFQDDKSEDVLEQIAKTIEIAKQHRLKLSAERLKQDILKIESKINIDEKEWKKKFESGDVLNLEKKHATIKEKVKDCEQQLSLVQDELEREKKTYNDNVQSIKATIEKLETGKLEQQIKQTSLTEDERKAKKESGQSELSLNQKIKSKLGQKIELTEAQIKYQKIKTDISEAQKKLKELEESLMQNQNELANLEKKYNKKHEKLIKQQRSIETKLQKKIKNLELVNSQLDPINTELQKLDKTIKNSKEELAKKQKELEETESELKKIFPEEMKKISASKTKRQPKTKTSAVTSDLFALPVTASTLQKELMKEIESQLDKFSYSSEAQKFKRQLIFGFSVGQRKTLEEIAKLDSSFTVKELEELLEGGTGVTNLFYLAQFLEQRIPQAMVGNDQVYVESLKQVQSDIKRSIKFAFRARAIERSLGYIENPNWAKGSLTKLTIDIISELQQTEMREGDRLFLPVGTTEHETLLCLQKGKDGKILTTLYNTGEGAEQQMAKGFNLKAAIDFFSQLQGEYPTSKTFKAIDSGQLEFQYMLFNVLNNRLVKGSVKDLNSNLTKFLGAGQSGKAKPLQINGVCSFQVLNEVFKDVMKPIDFLKFQRDLLMSIQEEFEDLTDRLSVKTEEETIIKQLHEKLLLDNQREIDEIKKRLEKSPNS